MKDRNPGASTRRGGPPADDGRHPEGRRRYRVAIAVVVGLLILAPMGTTLTAAAAATPCTAPVVSPVACENTLAGTDPSQWDIGVGADESIEGFATANSVNVGGTIGFKIHTNAAQYTVAIYRMGYYGGLGARFITNVTSSVPLANRQPSCLSDTTTGLVDCGNWAQTGSWTVPTATVSGVFMAILTRTDTGGRNEIPFVVRNDASTSKVVFQTSDTTWEAYNDYGGNSLYAGSPAFRAYKVSFNRPYRTRFAQPNGQDFFFGAEYPMVRFLEANGYDLSYISGVDTDRAGALLKNHSTFLSVGHDEYWSGAQRANVESARDAGVNLAFFSGNESFWKTRYEPSIDGSNTAYRTLVTYKETKAGAKIDPSAAWTGTWRDSRFSPPADGGRPENAMTGQLFLVNCCDSTFTVPQADGQMRLWRNTSVASLPVGGSATLQSHTLGYESDVDTDNGFRPAGLIDMSTSTNAMPEVFIDEGNTVAPRTVTHHLTMYKAPSGARVFGAGTIQWSYGLDSEHDGPATTADVRMKQATVNILADMNAQPQTLQSGLVAAAKTTDTTAPTITITSPAANASINNGAAITVTGTATDAGGRVGGVEVSLDGGASWHPATGRGSWSYSGFASGTGATSIRARATDDSGNTSAAAAVSVTAKCPCTIFGQSAPTSAVSSEVASLELGTRFQPAVSGFVTGIRFYKGPGNTGTHTGTLWTNDGTLLATGTFSNETSTGWQTLSFPTPVPISGGVTYVASYHTPTGHYYGDNMGFEDLPYVRYPLTALRDTDATPNGVYLYGNGFPTGSSGATNYWVDAVFTTSGNDTTPPTVTSQTPLAGASSVLTSTTVAATFSEPVNPAVNLTLKTGTTNVPGTVSYNTGTRTATFTPSAPLAAGTQYTASAIATDTAGNVMPTATTWSFTTANASAPGTCPCSLFSDATVPTVPAANDSGSVELGSRFSSEVSGTVTAIRFYKGPGNNGTHTGALWTTGGTKLASVTFTNESSQGWQQANLSTPVAINANTTYIVSYHAPNGHYAAEDGGFTGKSVDNPPLHAAASTPSALNGLFIYGATAAFPTGSYHDTNYSVDIVFSPTVDNTTPTVVTKTPTAGAGGVPLGSVVATQFSKAVTPASIVFSLKDAANNAVAGTSGYNTTTNTFTFTPSAPLAAGTAYTADVSGATDGAGHTMVGHVTWTFTTAAATGSCPCSVFSVGTVPGSPSISDAGAVELGMRFQADVNGSVTGIRFYKGTGNTGTHVGSLWSASGSLLARVTFTNESAGGWQLATLSAPVAVTAGTTYVVSYYAPNGHYAGDNDFFATTGVDNAPLHAPVSSATALNGLYSYGGAPVFPSSSWRSSNYYVDVTFTPS